MPARGIGIWWTYHFEKVKVNKTLQFDIGKLCVFLIYSPQKMIVEWGLKWGEKPLMIGKPY